MNKDTQHDELRQALEHAHDLVNASLPTIPLCRPLAEKRCTASWHEQCERAGKRPLIKGYPALAGHPGPWAEVERRIRRHWPCNLGIVTGGDMLAIETDSPEGEQEVERLAGDVLADVPTRERRPGRGRAWLFATQPGQAAVNRAHLGKSGAIDIRGEGGILVVPPSVHLTGHCYCWLPDHAPWQMTLQQAPSRLLALLPPPRRPERQRQSHTPIAEKPETGLVAGVSLRVAFLLRSYSQLTFLWNGQGKHGGDQSASGYDFTLACELLSRNIPPGEVMAALLARPGVHRRDPDYALLTVERARQIPGGMR